MLSPMAPKIGLGTSAASVAVFSGPGGITVSRVALALEALISTMVDTHTWSEASTCGAATSALRADPALHAGSVETSQRLMSSALCVQAFRRSAACNGGNCRCLCSSESAQRT